MRRCLRTGGRYHRVAPAGSVPLTRVSNGPNITRSSAADEPSRPTRLGGEAVSEVTVDDDAATGPQRRGAAELSLVDQAELTVGAGWWHTAGAPGLGLEGVHVTDGPNGARGERWGEISACMPSATALASTWDRDLVQLIGEVLGDEALDKVLACCWPRRSTFSVTRLVAAASNVSLRTFLSAVMAVAYVQGVQSRGVGWPSSTLSATIWRSNGCRSMSRSTSARYARSTWLPSKRPSGKLVSAW